MIKNKIFPAKNELLQFDNLTGTLIQSLKDEIISETGSSLNQIKSISSEERTFENTLLAWDRMYDSFNSGLSVIYLLAYVHPNEDVITESQKSISDLNKLWNEIQLDVDIYTALSEFEKKAEAKSLKPEFSRFLEKLLHELKRNGLGLPEKERNEIKEIKNRISDLSLQFSSNIAAVQDELIVTEEEINGLPDDYKEMRKNEDGTYKIDLSYPSYHPFMKYSESEPARKKLYIRFKNRASEANLPILKELLGERKKLANMLGFKTYADWEIDDKMAKKAETVWEFENSLAGKVKLKARFDLDELLQVKKEFLDSDNENIINAWESAFYSNLILKNKYQVDQEEVKEYFELNNVINGLFEISERLFGLKFEKAEQASVWHPEVIPYHVYQNGNKWGYFYLDLHPRAKKYSHAACFSLVNGKKFPGEEQLPVATLVCNFPKPSKTKPSLLPHSDVETLFHEFGHLLHHLLSETELAAQAGISTAHDFVEVPSQLFENWAWDYEALSLFAKHHKTGEVLPAELYKKMLAARNLGSGIHTLQQIFYGLLDMTLHNRYDPDGETTTTEIVRHLQNSITPFPFLDGTYMEAGFDHLTGYAAGYYGYLWAKVYAEDIFSVFKMNGVFSREVGMKLKDTLLSKGSTMEEKDILLSFLGREPDDKAFLKSLGL
jgi:thimet oligopeptidase